MTQFKKLVASPFFNNGRNYIPLLNELQKHHPQFDKDSFTYELTYRKLFPGKKFNKQVLWNMVSGLEKLAMEFLLQNAYKRNKQERFTLLFSELSRRNLDKQGFKEIEKAGEFIKSIKMGKDYFYGRWRIEDDSADYWTSVKGRQDKSLGAIARSSEYLILNFLVDISALLWDIHLKKVMYSNDHEVTLAFERIKSLDLKHFVDLAKQSKSKYYGITKFYYDKLMCVIDEKNESYFFDMKQFFEDNYDKLDDREKGNTIITLGNYCSHKARMGNYKFQRIHFQINKFRLEKEIGVFEYGKITKALYNQILRSALSLNEIKWAEEFEKSYTPLLPKEQQKTMHTLAMAYIYFAKKEFETVISHLNKVEFIELRDKLQIRILSAKVYYELNKTELLFYYIDSSKHFIANNPIEKITKEATMKFFYFLDKLLTLKEKPEHEKMKSLKEDIDIDETLRSREKNWLLTKLSNIKL